MYRHLGWAGVCQHIFARHLDRQCWYGFLTSHAHAITGDALQLPCRIKKIPFALWKLHVVLANQLDLIDWGLFSDWWANPVLYFTKTFSCCSMELDADDLECVPCMKANPNLFILKVGGTTPICNQGAYIWLQFADNWQWYINPNVLSVQGITAWQTQVQQQRTAVHSMWLSARLLVEQTVCSRSAIVFSVYLVTTEVKRLRSSVLKIQQVVVSTSEYWCCLRRLFSGSLGSVDHQSCCLCEINCSCALALLLHPACRETGHAWLHRRESC